MNAIKVGILALALVLNLAVCSSAHEGGHGPGHPEPTNPGTPADHGGHAQPATAPTAAGGLTPSLEVEPETPRVGDTIGLTFRVEEDGVPLTSYEVVHEKTSHLIVVSDDLGVFQHIHPELDGEGTFRVSTSLPKAGRYFVYLDVTPEGSDQLLHRFELEVAEREASGLQPDLSPKTIESTLVSLTTEPATLKPGDAMLRFRLEAGGQPVSDLVPYLGAMGHAVAIGESGEPFLHIHPLEGPAMDGEGMEEHAGHAMPQPSAESQPGEVVFHASFPAPGLYKLWGQFQRGSTLITAPFVVEVR